MIPSFWAIVTLQQKDGVELGKRVQDVEAKLRAKLEDAQRQLRSKTQQVQQLQEALETQRQDNATTREMLQQTEKRVLVCASICSADSQ